MEKQENFKYKVGDKVRVCRIANNQKWYLDPLNSMYNNLSIKKNSIGKVFVIIRSYSKKEVELNKDYFPYQAIPIELKATWKNSSWNGTTSSYMQTIYFDEEELAPLRIKLK